MTDRSPKLHVFNQLGETICLVGQEIPRFGILQGFQINHGDYRDHRQGPHEKDIERLRPVFLAALWTFVGCSKFTFTPAHSGRFAADLYPLTGECLFEDGLLKFQAEKHSQLTVVTLDGVIRFDPPGVSLRAIYTIPSYLHPPLIATVEQRLIEKDASEPAQSSLDNQSEGSPSPYNLSLTATQPSLSDLDLDKLVSSYAPPNTEHFLFMPSDYDIELSGRTGAGPFGPLQGTLSLRAPAISATPQGEIPGVLLMVNGACANGWLRCQILDGKANARIQINDNSLKLVLAAESPNEFVEWWVERSQYAGRPVRIRVKRWELSLTIDGDDIAGEIIGQGIHDGLLPSQKPGTYCATFTGQRIAIPVRRLRELIMHEPVDGTWQTPPRSLGTVDLTQVGSSISGSFTARNGGHITGRRKGRRIDFTWKGKKRQSGWAWCRLMSDGTTLAGMLFRTGSTHGGESVLATMEPFSFLSRYVFTEKDRMELSFLGKDIARGGKFRLAFAILEEALSLYRRDRDDLSLDAMTRTLSLVSETSLLTYLLNSYLQAGDYEKLLAKLEEAAEVGTLLNPNEQLFSRLRSTNVKLNKAITKQTTYLQYIEQNLSLIDQLLASGCIGIVYRFDEASGGWIITEVNPNSPAQHAGLRPGDMLVAIDGQSTSDLKITQIMRLLKGREGTDVKLLTERQGMAQEKNLTRSRWPGLSETRPLEIENLRRKQRHLIAMVRCYMLSFASGLDNYSTKARQKETDVAGLAQTFAIFLTSSSKVIEEILAQAYPLLEKAFAGHERLVQLARPGFFMADYDALHPGYYDLFLENDRKLYDEINATDKLCSPDKDLFYEHLKLVCLASLIAELRGEASLYIALDEGSPYARQMAQAREAASGLAHFLERWRARLINDSDKLTALEMGEPLFNKLVRLLVNWGGSEAALVISEQARARAFIDLLYDRGAGENSPANKRITRAPVSSVITAPPPKLEQIRQFAQAQRATIVEYFLTDDARPELLIWVVPPEGGIFFAKADPTPLLPAGQSYIAQFSWVSRGTAHLEREFFLDDVAQASDMDKARLSHLSEVLVRPVEHLLPPESGARVIFIPYRSLFLAPFCALSDADGTHLIDRYVITIAPSIQLLELIQARQTGASKPSRREALVIGNPEMPALPTSWTESGGRLPRLPGAEREARAVADILGVEPLLGAAATKSRVMKLMPGRQLIHFATHGSIDDLSGAGIPGVLALSALGSAAEGDSFLTSREIMGLRLRADLVVLSACQSGLGRLTGDGVVGLSRAFIAAGASSVIVSLWRVWDDSTADLMIDFYKRYCGGQDKAWALRESMLAMKKSDDRPSVWAPFTIVGID